MHWLENWVLPAKCVLSDEPTQGIDLSAQMIDQLKVPNNVCPQCCEPIVDANLCGRCLATPPAFDRTQVGFYFEEPMIDLVYALKYQKQHAYGRLLVDLILRNLEVDKVDALIAVPIHKNRWRQRGFNQADVLASNLSRQTGLPVIKKGLLRVKDSPSQTGLTLSQRQQNLRGAFKIEKEVFAGYEKLAIIDDVMTTNSTMQALATLIKRQTQVDYIEAWAVAKTK